MKKRFRINHEQTFQSLKNFENRDDEMQAVGILREVKLILDRNNIKYWLDSGTLLGAIRDKKIIPWDTDIDIGLWYRDLSQVYEVIKEIKHFNCEIIYKYGPISEFGEIENSRIGSLRGIFIKKNGIALGIEPYVLLNDEAKRTFLLEKRSSFTMYIQRLINIISKSHQRDINNNFSLKTKLLLKLLNLIPLKCIMIFKNILFYIYKKGKVNIAYIPAGIPAQFFGKFSKIWFYDMEFNIPQNYEKYLSFRYGVDWRIPRKKWVHYINDGSSICNK